jgi:hypothetical protein
MYINGLSVGSYTDTTNYQNSDLKIGKAWDSNHWNGYMSNVRIVKGTAVYTANFTPPTESLTAVSGTSLLTLQDNRFIDRSTNNFAITRVVDVRITPFSPFLPTAIYEPATHGGSAYFDGTGDFLSTTISSFGTGNFTIEGWVYNTGAVSNVGVFHLATSGFPGSVTGLALAYFASGGGWNLYYANGSQTNGVGVSPVPNTWYHFAVTRSGTALRLYINGILTVSVTDSTNYSLTSMNIGGYYSTSVLLTGYISNFRVVSGTALYTADFTPPTSPVTAVANTSLLLNFTNSNIYDETGKVVLETVGDAKVSTSVVKYGGGSMVFDGSGDYLLSPSDPIYDFPANFTIEMWLNLANVASDWQTIISRAYTVAGGWRLYKTTSANELRWYVGSSLVVTTTQGHLSNNTWAHVAVVRNNGVATVYINGVSRGSASNATNLTPGNYAIEIGGGVQGGSYPMTGYISDLRITNGRARYTANFTPPTAKLGYSNAE